MASSKNKNKVSSPTTQTAPVTTPTAVHVVSESLPNGTHIPVTIVLDAPEGTTKEGATVAAPTGTTPAKERQRYPIGMEEFAIAYNSSANLAEVSKRLKMPVAAIASRAQYYKNKKKLNLQAFRAGPTNNVDVVALNKKLDAIVAERLAAMQKTVTPNA